MIQAIELSENSDLGRYQPYSAYKDSGIEWLDDIPFHWKSTRIKNISNFANGFAYSSSEWRESGFPVVRMSNISPIGELNITEANIKYIDEKSAERSRAFKLYKNDVLIAMTDMSPKMGVLGKTIIFTKEDKDCYLNQRVGRIRLTSSEVDLEFFHLVTNSEVCREQIKSTVFPNVQYNASTEAIKTSVIPVPPLQEQIRIAEFLIRKTAAIDKLIAKKEQLIELLVEKRAAVITQAVTKGLDAAVPMKDSGVEWLGEIPAHWEYVRIKRIAEVTYGVGGEIDPTIEEGIPIISLPNVSIDGNLDLSQVPKKILAEEEKQRYLLKKGDLIFNWRNGSSKHVGKTAIFTEDGDYTLVSFLLRIRFTDGHYESSYFKRYLNTLRATGFFLSTKAGVNNTFNSSELRELEMLVPSPKEQLEIEQALNRQISSIDLIVRNLKESIRLLMEQRTALISAAVTGKIDVRATE